MRVVGAATLGLAMTFAVPRSASAASGGRIAENDPDRGNVRIAATVYYALINRAYFNWGGHGQVTLSPIPEIELQGAGMLNLPSSGISFLRMEGSAYLAVTSLDTANVTLSQSSDGRFVTTEYVPVPGAMRKKFGVEVGGLLDRHGVYFYPRDNFRHSEDPAIPMMSLGAFGGLKWVRQTNIRLTNGAAQYLRTVYFIHVIRALTQKIELPPGETDVTYTPWGGRVGLEMGGSVGTGIFMRAEGGAMPGIRGPDFNMFLMLGVTHADALF